MCTICLATVLCSLTLISILAPYVAVMLQEFLANIADLCPEYCIRSIVLDLLQSDSVEAQLLGLHTLHVIATSVPVGQSTSLGLQGCAIRNSTTLALRGSSSTSNSLAGSATNSRHMMQVS